MRRSSKKLRQNPTSLMQKLFTAGLIFTLLIIAVAAGLIVFDRVRQFIAASEMMPTFTSPVTPDPDVEYEPGDPMPDWQGKERINILAMGIDQRESEEGPWRTDTMLVLTIDPVTMSAGMLSIPRDLWVPIPGYEEGRINQAHFLGEAYDYPGGGPALAAETVQYNLGVPIHHHVRINFTAFERAVDLIGGIDIYVEEEIDDPTYPERDGPGYDPLYIPAGEQHMDGELALKYARTRHSMGGDFDRAKRQQQVLLAVFEKATRLDMLPQLAPKIPTLWREMEDSVVTDLKLDQLIALANLAREIDPEDIHYAVIDEHYTQFYTTPDGQQVLIPVREQMRELRDYIFTTEVPMPESSDPESRLAAEAATVEVLNGTTVEGLAGLTADHLTENQFDVSNVGNADRSDYQESLIIVYTGKNYTAEYIANFLSLPPTAVVHGAEPNAEYDITLILGEDYTPPEVTPAPSPTPE